MKIFGKRPFVLKTGDMANKIDNIQAPSGYKSSVNINKVKEKLTEFSNNANFFKKIQEAASDIKECFPKGCQAINGQEVNKKTKKLGMDVELEKITLSDTEVALLESNIPELYKYFWKIYFKQLQELKIDNLEASDLDDLMILASVRAEKLEKECRKVKQGFKDDFEKVYKALKSYIKKLEKANKKGRSEEYIKKVAESEIEVFEEYDISV